MKSNNDAKNNNNNNKKHIKKVKEKKFKNLYTLHVFIKVTEPVRILDSSWIQQQILSQ